MWQDGKKRKQAGEIPVCFFTAVYNRRTADAYRGNSPTAKRYENRGIFKLISRTNSVLYLITAQL